MTEALSIETREYIIRTTADWPLSGILAALTPYGKVLTRLPRSAGGYIMLMSMTPQKAELLAGQEWIAYVGPDRKATVI